MVKAFAAGPTGNGLLNLLPPAEFKVIGRLLRNVELKQGQTLYESRGRIDEVYFPVNCALSAVTVMKSGNAIEVATVGNEGVSGLPALTMVTTSPHRVFAQIPGSALKADAVAFSQAVEKLPRLRETITKYQQAFMFQVSQCVACNGLHMIVGRSCRWLLMTHDRVEGDELALTHEFLSFMLGVRRAGITEVLQSLQSKGLISYGKGKITVLKRSGLEKLACECYECVKDEYDRLLRS
jgi:CRP-like cAMP-binding protein